MKRYDIYTQEGTPVLVESENGEVVKYAELTKPKRKPDANGVLPLTEKELKTFENLVDEENIEIVILKNDGLEIRIKDEPCKLAVYEIKAILWLAERFNLGE